jgi:hypothetical protein
MHADAAADDFVNQLLGIVEERAFDVEQMNLLFCSLFFRVFRADWVQGFVTFVASVTGPTIVGR